MGKRGQKGGGGGAAKKADADPVLAAALAAGGMFKPLPPNKRHELGQIVEKLFLLCSSTPSSSLSPPALFQEHVSIRELVDQVRKLEECNLNRPLLGSRQAHADILKEWIEKFGGKIEGVEVAHYKDSGLGLRCTSALTPGSPVLTIPRKCLMSVDTAKDSEIGRLIEKDPMLKTMSNVALSLHLLLEKTSPASFWEPYINTLPQSYSTVLYFTAAELQELKGSPAFEDALRQYKYVARQYAYFYRKFEGTILKDYFTYDEYRWAVSTVMTRQNQIPSLHEEEQFVNSLIPFWDLSNHANGAMSTDYDDEAHAVKCMANRDFKPEEQFTIFYGPRANHDLLVHNGFVVEDNQSDHLVIRLGISSKDELSKSKNELLAKISISPHGHFTLKAGPDPVEPNLLAFLRVMCLKTPEEVDQWSDAEKVKSLLLQDETDKELDKKAFQYLSTRCTLLLRSYPTNLEEDVKLREGEEFEKYSLPKRFALILRKGEKNILNETIRYCQNKLQ